MATVTCSVCEQEMTIDTVDGVAYVTESDETIHHAYDCTVVEGDGDADE